MRNSVPLTSILLACALVPPLSAQRYSADSFEAPAFQLGALAGPDLWSGQDEWIVFGGDASAQVQNTVVRSGEQAVTWDAALLSTTGELRRNELFSHSADEVLEITFDFRIDSSAQPSAAWMFTTQYAPIPCSEQFRWIVRADGEVWMRQGQNCVSTSWNQTGTYVPKDVWLHARTLVDTGNDLVELWIDGVPIAQSNVNAFTPLAEHGFTQVFCDGPGDDRLHLDNFVVRTRPREALALTVDLGNVDAADRVIARFQMHAGTANANRFYMLLGTTSGTAPGLPLSGGLTLPLNPDGLTRAMVSPLPTNVFAGFQSSFDSNGFATATFDSIVALPVLAGTTMHFAYVPFFPIDAVSEPVAVQWQ